MGLVLALKVAKPARVYPNRAIRHLQNLRPRDGLCCSVNVSRHQIRRQQGMGLRVHLINPSDTAFGTAVITPRWLFVLAAATPDELRAHLAPQFASWWLPDAVVRVTAMPLAMTGKIDKKRLRVEFGSLTERQG